MDLIKVSATSRTAAVAGAIAGIVREHHRAEVQAIGAGAVNQAMKAPARTTATETVATWITRRRLSSASSGASGLV